MNALDAFVERIRRTTGRGNEIPHFSRFDGGVGALCLFLFETPNRVAVERGYAERENRDPSARNFEDACDAAGLDRELTISWNIVPWQSADPTPATAREALPWLGELLDLLPELRVVVLFGTTAREATSYLYRHHSDLCVLHAPHPSNRSLGPHPERHEHLQAAVKKAVRELAR